MKWNMVNLENNKARLFTGAFKRQHFSVKTKKRNIEGRCRSGQETYDMWTLQS